MKNGDVKMVWEDPFDDIERMRKKFRKMFAPGWYWLTDMAGEFEDFPVDIGETDDDLLIKADLPGFEKQDVAIRITENTLEISAQKKEERKEQTEKMFRAERRYGSLRRFLTLPVAVDNEKAKAEMKNGTLTITVPKKEKKKTGKEIKVQ